MYSCSGEGRMDGGAEASNVGEAGAGWRLGSDEQLAYPIKDAF